MEEAPPLSRWFVWRLLLFSAVAGSLFGFDTGIVSGSLVSIQTRFNMTRTDTQWYVASTQLTAAFASVGSAPLSASYGRKPVMGLGAVLSTIGAALLASANGIPTLITGRVVIGASIGLTSATAPMYASELAPPATRGVIVALNDFSIVAGQLLAGLVNCGFIYVTGGWRYAVGLAAVPALLLLLALYTLPESPRWLYLKGDTAAAQAALSARRSDEKDGGSEEGRIEFSLMCDSLDAERRQQAGSKSGGEGVSGVLQLLTALWTDVSLRRASLLGLLLMGMNQLSGVNTVMYYSATIFTERYGETMAVWLAAACDAAQLCGVLISLYTIDTQGRRLTGLRSCACVALALIALAVSYALTFDGAPTLSLLLIFAYLLAFGSGLSGVGWVVISEIYPMRVRATAVSQAVFAHWIFNALVSHSFLSLASAIGYSGTFAIYASIASAGGLLLYLYLPETSGMRLEDIERLFAEPYTPPARGGGTAGRSTPLKESSALLPVAEQRAAKQ